MATDLQGRRQVLEMDPPCAVVRTAPGWLNRAMAELSFPRRHLPALQEAAAHILDRLGPAAKPDALASELLDELFDFCTRYGLDGVIVELERAHALAIPDGSALSHEPRLRSELAARLADRSAFDPRGPLQARRRQLVECLLASLGLVVADAPARTVELGDDVRRAVGEAFASAEASVEAPRLRAAAIATARGRCDAEHLGAFERIAPALDDRLAVPRGLRVPLAAVQEVQRLLADARAELLARAANDALDRAKQVIGAANAEAAARIDLPITARRTPREVAVQRVCAPGLSSLPGVFARTLFEALTELVDVAWGPAVPTARPYRATQTYAAGDHIEHPTFGRGIVKVAAAQRIEVEFPDGRHTLIHARS